MVYSLLIGLFSFCILILFTVFNKSCIPETQNAVTMFLNTILPTMFPFYVLSSLISSTSFLEKLFAPVNKFLSRLLKIPFCSISAILLGFLCGFPVGAKIICDLKTQNKISDDEAMKLSAFTNNVGPIFMTSVIGSTYLRSAKFGFIIWLSVILSAFISAIIICNPKLQIHPSTNYLKTDILKPVKQNINISDAILSGLNTVLYVGAVIIFFSSITSILKLIPNISPLYYSIAYSSLEITGGIKELISVFNLQNNLYKYLLVSFFAAWSGLCVHIQVCGILVAGKVKLKYYFLGKLLQMLFAPFICFLLISVFL